MKKSCGKIKYTHMCGRPSTTMTITRTVVLTLLQFGHFGHFRHFVQDIPDNQDIQVRLG
jgi:hypothetical protein